ncbi:hypothetical protein C8R44DRAFT_973508 [Mycena epipterygia]|nr:hypothetical protein C8R44DRAFT_973508 [Mycena epipterygia]
MARIRIESQRVPLPNYGRMPRHVCSYFVLVHAFVCPNLQKDDGIRLKRGGVHATPRHPEPHHKLGTHDQPHAPGRPLRSTPAGAPVLLPRPQRRSTRDLSDTNGTASCRRPFPHRGRSHHARTPRPQEATSTVSRAHPRSTPRPRSHSPITPNRPPATSQYPLPRRHNTAAHARARTPPPPYARKTRAATRSPSSPRRRRSHVARLCPAAAGADLQVLARVRVARAAAAARGAAAPPRAWVWVWWRGER